MESEREAREREEGEGRRGGGEEGRGGREGWLVGWLVGWCRCFFVVACNTRKATGSTRRSIAVSVYLAGTLDGLFLAASRSISAMKYSFCSFAKMIYKMRAILHRSTFKFCKTNWRQYFREICSNCWSQFVIIK